MIAVFLDNFFFVLLGYGRVTLDRFEEGRACEGQDRGDGRVHQDHPLYHEALQQQPEQLRDHEAGDADQSTGEADGEAHLGPEILVEDEDAVDRDHASPEAAEDAEAQDEVRCGGREGGDDQAQHLETGTYDGHHPLTRGLAQGPHKHGDDGHHGHEHAQHGAPLCG